MKNETQLERYKKLLSYIDERFKEDINIKKVESISHYSYRNINRIFQALQHETIGKYIKRIRLEKAAQYLKYSDTSVSDIAYDSGFENVPAFSKAFKNKFNCSPSTFRKNNETIRTIIQHSITFENDFERKKLQFEIEYLDDFEFLYLQYTGSYDDFSRIEKAWQNLLDYSLEKEISNKNSIFMTEIIDDNEISDSHNFRTNLAIILKQPLFFDPSGLFMTKTHKRQKYAKFMHKGKHETIVDFYNEIYAFWMIDVGLEFEDLPILELYLSQEDASSEEFVTEIYIAIK